PGTMASYVNSSVEVMDIRADSSANRVNLKNAVTLFPLNRKSGLVTGVVLPIKQVYASNLQVAWCLGRTFTKDEGHWRVVTSSARIGGKSIVGCSCRLVEIERLRT